MAIIESGNVIEGSGLKSPLRNAGAPTTTTYVKATVIGSLLIDTVNGKLYICTANNGTAATWTVVGAQT